MKKIANILIIIVILFSLTACSLDNKSDDNKSDDKMYIGKSELTEEEQSILKFVGTETPYILDFVVDDTVQSLQINVYELKGDEWKLISGGGGQQLNVKKGRIALVFDNIGLELRTAVEDIGAVSYKMESDFEFEGLSSTTSYLTDKTPIEYEKEIPLVIQVYTSKSIIQSFSPEHGFFEPQIYADFGHEKVYAITCLFSQKTVSELSRQKIK